MTTTADGITPQTGAGWLEQKQLTSNRMLREASPYWEDSRQVKSTLQLEWLDTSRAMTEQLLAEHRAHFEAIVATFEHNSLVIRVLSTNTEFLEPFERAKARLEIRLTRDLSQQFEDVVVRSVPVWGISEQERAAIMQGAIHLMPHLNAER